MLRWSTWDVKIRKIESWGQEILHKLLTYAKQVGQEVQRLLDHLQGANA